MLSHVGGAFNPGANILSLVVLVEISLGHVGVGVKTAVVLLEEIQSDESIEVVFWVPELQFVLFL